MRPALHESVAAEYLFEPGSGRGVQAEELDVMARIDFVDGDDVRGVVVEGGQPLLLLPGRPVGFDGRDVVVGLSRLSRNNAVAKAVTVWK